MSEEVNPFAAPQTAPEPYLADQEVDDGVEATRRKYLKHEASVKSIGILYYLGGIFTGLASVVFVVTAIQGGTGPMEPLVVGVVLLLFTFVSILGGYWLRRLDRRARWIVGFSSGLGLLQLPIGTLINAYILWLVFGEKGKVVFSSEYQEVIAKTPHIKYRSSKLMIVLLIIVLALLAVAIGSAVFLG